MRGGVRWWHLIDEAQHASRGEFVPYEVEEGYARRVPQCLSESFQADVADEVIVQTKLTERVVLPDSVGKGFAGFVRN